MCSKETGEKRIGTISARNCLIQEGRACFSSLRDQNGCVRLPGKSPSKPGVLMWGGERQGEE